MNHDVTRKKWPAVLVAALTPRRGGRLDRPGFAANVVAYHAAGLDGVLCGGSTGRGDDLDPSDLIEELAIVKARGPGMEIIAGIGAKEKSLVDVQRYIDLVSHSADALLVPPPESDPEVLPFFAALVGQSSLPLLVYHPPGRRAAPFPASLSMELASMEGLAGVKDSTGHEHLIEAWRSGRPDFRLLLGNLDLFSRRSGDVDGAILAFANIRPEYCLDLSRGEAETAEVVRIEKELVAATGLAALAWFMDGRGLRGVDLPD